MIQQKLILSENQLAVDTASKKLKSSSAGLPAKNQTSRTTVWNIFNLFLLLSFFSQTKVNWNFTIITSLFKGYLRRKICLEFLKCDRKDLLISSLCVKRKLEELRGHKVLPVMSRKFYQVLISHSKFIKKSVKYNLNFDI